MKLLDGLWKNVRCGLLVRLSTMGMEEYYDSEDRAVVLTSDVKQLVGFQSKRITFKAVVEIVRGDYSALSKTMMLTSVLPKRSDDIMVVKVYSFGTGRMELWKIEGLVI